MGLMANIQEEWSSQQNRRSFPCVHPTGHAGHLHLSSSLWKWVWPLTSKMAQWTKALGACLTLEVDPRTPREELTPRLVL